MTEDVAVDADAGSESLEELPAESEEAIYDEDDVSAAETSPLPEATSEDADTLAVNVVKETEGAVVSAPEEIESIESSVESAETLMEQDEEPSVEELEGVEDAVETTLMAATTLQYFNIIENTPAELNPYEGEMIKLSFSVDVPAEYTWYENGAVVGNGPEYEFAAHSGQFWCVASAPEYESVQSEITTIYTIQTVVEEPVVEESVTDEPQPEVEVPDIAAADSETITSLMDESEAVIEEPAAIISDQEALDTSAEVIEVETPVTEEAEYTDPVVEEFISEQPAESETINEEPVVENVEEAAPDSIEEETATEPITEAFDEVMETESGIENEAETNVETPGIEEVSEN